MVANKKSGKDTKGAVGDHIEGIVKRMFKSSLLLSLIAE
jgi:hypothetical protein